MQRFEERAPRTVETQDLQVVPTTTQLDVASERFLPAEGGVASHAQMDMHLLQVVAPQPTHNVVRSCEPCPDGQAPRAVSQAGLKHPDKIA